MISKPTVLKCLENSIDKGKPTYPKPTTAILCFYTSIIYFLNKNYTKSFLILIGFSLVFFCLFHNVYFGKTYKFFTNTEMHFIFNTAFLKYNSQINNSNLILSQLLLWMKLWTGLFFGVRTVKML